MASILETFTILFEADSKNVEEGSKKAEKSKKDLQKALNSTEVSSQKIGSSFLGMMKSASGFLTAALSLGAITVGIKSAAKYADELGKLSEVLGITTEDLDAYSKSVKLSGGSSESFANSANSLNASLNEFATKGTSRAAPFFEKLGVSMLDANGNARKLTDVLPDLADSFQNLSKTEAFGIGQKIGLDQGTIALLIKGKKELKEVIRQQNEFGVTTKRDADIAANFNDALDRQGFAFKSLFTKINSSILPVFTKIIDIFSDVVGFISTHSDFIKGAIIAIGTAVAVFLVPPLITAAISMIALNAPILLIIAAVSALIAIFSVLYEDFSRFFKGQSSFIGDMVKKWPILGDIINDVVEGIVYWINEFKKALQFTWDLAVLAAKGIAASWKFVFDLIKSGVDLIFSSIDKIKNAFNAVKDFLGGGESLDAKMKITNENLMLAEQLPLSSITRATMSNLNNSLTKNTSVNVANVNVNTQATDAQGIASAVGNSLQNEIRSVISQNDDGVSA